MKFKKQIITTNFSNSATLSKDQIFVKVEEGNEIQIKFMENLFNEIVDEISQF
jgi:hypothetical protein